MSLIRRLLRRDHRVSHDSTMLERDLPRRHPADLARLVLGLFGFAATMLIASRDTVAVFEQDLFRLINDLPALLEPPLTVFMQAGNALFAIVVVAIALLARRFLVARDLALSALVARLAAEAFKVIVGRGRPGDLLSDVVLRGTHPGIGFPSGHVTLAAALAAALGPYVSRPVRRALWGVVFLVAAGRMYVGAHFPLDVVGGWLLGWAIGATVHLAFGSPSWVVAKARVAAAVAGIGLTPVSIVRPHLDARGSTPFVVTDPEGRRFFVKALSNDQRDADWLFKGSRFLLFRNVEDEIPSATPKRQLEHEAYIQMLAHRAGARVPHVREVVALDRADALLVMEAIDGTDAAGAPDALTDTTLDLLWEDVALLQRHRIAHRDLRAANVLVDPGGRPWIVDFGFAEASASVDRMAVDVAELLVSLALAVGNERSIAPAVRHIDPEVLRRCPPLLQRAALSAATRHAIGSRHGLLEDLRARLSREIGIEEPPRKAPLLRVRPRSIVLLVLAALALHVLLPQIGEIPRTLTALRSIHLDWVAILLLASVLTYLGAAVSLVAACPVGLPFLRTLAVVTAASFANRLAPSGLGRAGLDIRYVERHGASRSVAVATEAINAIGGGIVHGVALVLAGVLFGGSAFGAVNLKGEVIVAIAVVGVLVAAGVVIVVGPWRGTVVATLTEAWGAFRTVTRQPAKAVRLLAGAVVLNAGYVIALQASLEAVGASVSAGTVALVYLGGAAIAAASPTPGGLGAAEAAYVAALAAAGVEASLAVAGVLVFRLVTFWLPTLPGWFAFRWLRHREYA